MQTNIIGLDRKELFRINSIMGGKYTLHRPPHLFSINSKKQVISKSKVIETQSGVLSNVSQHHRYVSQHDRPNLFLFNPKKQVISIFILAVIIVLPGLSIAEGELPKIPEFVSFDSGQITSGRLDNLKNVDGKVLSVTDTNSLDEYKTIVFPSGEAPFGGNLNWTPSPPLFCPDVYDHYKCINELNADDVSTRIYAFTPGATDDFETCPFQISGCPYKSGEIQDENDELVGLRIRFRMLSEDNPALLHIYVQNYLTTPCFEKYQTVNTFGVWQYFSFDYSILDPFWNDACFDELHDTNEGGYEIYLTMGDGDVAITQIAIIATWSTEILTTEADFSLGFLEKYIPLRAEWTCTQNEINGPYLIGVLNITNIVRPLGELCLTGIGNYVANLTMNDSYNGRFHFIITDFLVYALSAFTLDRLVVVLTEEFFISSESLQWLVYAIIIGGTLFGVSFMFYIWKKKRDGD